MGARGKAVFGREFRHARPAQTLSQQCKKYIDNKPRKPKSLGELDLASRRGTRGVRVLSDVDATIT